MFNSQPTNFLKTVGNLCLFSLVHALHKYCIQCIWTGVYIFTVNFPEGKRTIQSWQYCFYINLILLPRTFMDGWGVWGGSVLIYLGTISMQISIAGFWSLKYTCAALHATSLCQVVMYILNVQCCRINYIIYTTTEHCQKIYALTVQ